MRVAHTSASSCVKQQYVYVGDLLGFFAASHCKSAIDFFAALDDLSRHLVATINASQDKKKQCMKVEMSREIISVSHYIFFLLRKNLSSQNSV